MRKFNQLLLIVMILLLIVNISLSAIGTNSHEWFDFKKVLGVTLFLLTGAYVHFFPTKIGWFGNKLNEASEANIIVSNIIAFIMFIGATLFNVIPLISYFLNY